MQSSTTRWTTAAAAAALIVVPGVAFAQTPTTPPQTAPTQQTPAQPQPAQPTADKPAAGAQVDAAAAKQHLSEARDTLSQLTSMPEAARLQGDTRTQVSQLISNFNELITTQANWRASYDKLNANLTSLLGADDQSAAPPAASGVAGATGTSGTTPPAAAAQMDPGIRGKLLEFRTHLKEFERAAGSGAAAPTTASDAPASASEPAPTTPPTMVTTPPAGTSGSTPAPTATAAASPTATAATAADQAKPADERMGHAEADKELDAITAIIDKSKTGTLTKAQTAELKKHVETLRTLLSQSK